MKLAAIYRLGSMRSSEKDMNIREQRTIEPTSSASATDGEPGRGDRRGRGEASAGPRSGVSA